MRNDNIEAISDRVIGQQLQLFWERLNDEERSRLDRASTIDDLTLHILDEINKGCAHIPPDEIEAAIHSFGIRIRVYQRVKCSVDAVIKKGTRSFGKPGV